MHRDVSQTGPARGASPKTESPARSGAGRRGPQPRGTPERVLAMRPCPPVTPGVSPQPSSAPVAPLLTPASAVASAACRRGPRRPPGGCLPTWQTLSRWQWRWGRAGEAASLGVLPRRPGTGTRLRSPGPGRRWGQAALPEQQREEMNNLGCPERPLPGAVGPGPPVRSVRPRHPKSPKRCHLYLLSS